MLVHAPQPGIPKGEAGSGQGDSEWLGKGLFTENLEFWLDKQSIQTFACTIDMSKLDLQMIELTTMC